MINNHMHVQTTGTSLVIIHDNLWHCTWMNLFYTVLDTVNPLMFARH